MSNLALWQKVSYVLKNKPFGDGKDGDATVASDPNVRTTFTGTDGENTGIAGADTMADGDLVMIIQSRGTGAGNWQWNLVKSGGGTVNLTFLRPLHYTFTAGAQIIKVPRYNIATITSHTTTQWDGITGGAEIIVARHITGGDLLAKTAGYNPGYGWTWYGSGGSRGESYNLLSSEANGLPTDSPEAARALWQQQSNNNTGGGGGAKADVVGAGGAGGGHATAGEGGGIGDGGGSPAQGGATVGVADLVSMFFGGPGGGGMGSHKDGNNNFGERGGRGGGILVLVCKTFTPTGVFDVSGEDGLDITTDTNAGGGGGGAGGSLLVICETATLGTALLKALGGLAGDSDSPAGLAGKGGLGRVAIHHSKEVTGTTTPTFTDISDKSIVEKLSSASMIF